jgi:hypothetical protein
VHTNHLTQVTRRTRSLLIATLVLAVLGAFGSNVVPQAHAGLFEQCDKTLLAKAQFCAEEMSSGEYLWFIDGENVTNENAVCVGPVHWNGKEYEYPYGWSCGGPKHTWEFEPIASVQPAVENPNSPSEAIGGGFDTEVAPRAEARAATNVSPSQATLQGYVHPESGFNVYYFFEYGKTTSYGSSTSEQSAGEYYSKGVSAAISGLQAGTAYHYRLVLKWSDKGTHYTYGSDSELKTPGPVEAVTAKPSDVQSQLAKLNGTVNPRGYDAKYYFQYGLTTSYGSTTSEGDAGAGQSAVAESATITGLVPGHIYHYRIVGTSGGVTSDGSDRTVATISGSNTTAYYSPAEEGLTDFVVEKADNKVHQALWTSGGGWKESAAVSIEVATGTNPSAFYEPAGEGPTAFFVGKADNKLHQSLWTAGTGWIESAGLTAEAATGTNPSAFYEVGAKGLAAFYVRKSDSKIHEALWTSGSGWTESGGLTAEVAAGTNPSAFYEPAGAGPTVFYVRKSDDKLHQSLWTAGTGWIESGGLTAEVATGTTPSAFYETGAKGPAVFYVRKSDGAIHEALWTSGSGWTESGAVTAEAATGTNPSAFYSPGGEGPTVFYVRKSDNKIHQALWTASSGWVESAALSAEVAAGATPSAFYYPGGEGFNVFFVSKADHKTHEINWTGSSGWTETGAVSLEAR